MSADSTVTCNWLFPFFIVTEVSTLPVPVAAVTLLHFTVIFAFASCAVNVTLEVLVMVDAVYSLRFALKFPLLWMVLPNCTFSSLALLSDGTRRLRL